jgi:hypothetical protein
MNKVTEILQRGLNLHCAYDRHSKDVVCPVCKWFLDAEVELRSIIIDPNPGGVQKEI